MRAFHHTYGLPVLTTNCSNNYGPYHFPEKLIPLVIAKALAGEPLPVYGDGRQVRDWLFVRDHCAAIRAVLAKGRVGETYNVGGNAEMQNIEVVKAICALLDQRRPRRRQAARIADRVRRRPPGHDRRYAIDASKLRDELGWEPGYTFERGIAETVDWYLANRDWVRRRARRRYRQDWHGRVKTNIGIPAFAGMTSKSNEKASSSPAVPARGCIRSPRRSASSCCRCTTSR